MTNECNIVQDLLPLYAENMVSPETAQFVQTHLRQCPDCQAELSTLQDSSSLAPLEQVTSAHRAEDSAFRTFMKRMNRRFESLAYLLIICFIFLGFGWTGGEHLMYNSLLMPVVGMFGYYVFRWKAVFKMPMLLLVVDLFVCASGLVDLSLYSAMLWTGIYSLFVLAGIVVAFLLHYAFRKEEEQ